MKVEYRAPRNETELDDTIECSLRAFGNLGDRRLRFTNIVKRDPWSDLNNTRACFVGGKAASVVQIFDRPMRIGNCVVRMGAVGSVGTDPSQRRAGYSSGVLQNSVRYMQMSGYDLSILSTGIHSHYARAGWVLHPTYSMDVTLPTTLGEVPTDVTIEQCEPNRDLPALQAIYNQFNASRTGTFFKNTEYWINRPRWRPYDPSLYWIAKQGGTTVAYLQTERWEVGEFGYLPDANRTMIALFCHFFRCAKAEGVQEINAPTPSESRKVFEMMGCSVRGRERSNIMVLITNFESLLTKIKPLLEARLKTSDFATWTGAIRIRYEADERTLVVGDGSINIVRHSESPVINLSVSQTQLLKLLFGNMNAEQIIFSNGLKIHEIDLLDTLFPTGELFMWRTDRF
jgi:hypothetical protein